MASSQQKDPGAKRPRQCQRFQASSFSGTSRILWYTSGDSHACEANQVPHPEPALKICTAPNCPHKCSGTACNQSYYVSGARQLETGGSSERLVSLFFFFFKAGGSAATGQTAMADLKGQARLLGYLLTPLWAKVWKASGCFWL